MSSSPVTNIGPVSGLKPQAAPHGDEYIVNMDGVIELIRTTDTPAAKRIYRVFRRIYAGLSSQDLSEEGARMAREKSITQAMRECGWTKPFGSGMPQ